MAVEILKCIKISVLLVDIIIEFEMYLCLRGRRGGVFARKRDGCFVKVFRDLKI